MLKFIQKLPQALRKTESDENTLSHCHNANLPPPSPRADPSLRLLLLLLWWYAWALTEVSGVTLPLRVAEKSGNRGFNVLKPVSVQNKAKY